MTSSCADRERARRHVHRLLVHEVDRDGERDHEYEDGRRGAHEHAEPRRPAVQRAAFTLRPYDDGDREQDEGHAGEPGEEARDVVA